MSNARDEAHAEFEQQSVELLGVADIDEDLAKKLGTHRRIGFEAGWRMALERAKEVLPAVVVADLATPEPSKGVVPETVGRLGAGECGFVDPLVAILEIGTVPQGGKQSEIQGTGRCYVDKAAVVTVDPEGRHVVLIHHLGDGVYQATGPSDGTRLSEREPTPQNLHRMAPVQWQTAS